MPKPDEPAEPTLTLGDLAAAGLGVRCICHRCGHTADLESGLLIRVLGPATPVARAADRLRCSSCGARDVAAQPAWVPVGKNTETR